MPGSWEYKQPEVLVSILTRELVSMMWAISFKNMILPSNSDVVFLSGMPFDHARNSACKLALERNFKYLMFLDDDVLVPPNAIETLISNNADIVSGLYYRRAEPILPVALIDGNPPAHINNFMLGSIVKADLVGAGCLLIHRRVLEKMGSKWFEWLVDREDLQPNDRISEDFAFCRKAKGLGFDIIVDTRVQCYHAGLGRSEVGGGFKPLTLL